VKKVQVIWSDEALTDLEAIYNFIAENSQSAAQKIVETILSRTSQLEAFPESGASQETLKTKSKEYRYLIEGHYKIVYSFVNAQNVVYVEVIFDTRLNPEKLSV
jgi:plasmid stabilization system protein ParE